MTNVIIIKKTSDNRVGGLFIQNKSPYSDGPNGFLF